MPKTVYFNVQGSPGGGGPSVFVYKTAVELAKRGIGVSYGKPQAADVCLCIIESGRTLSSIDRKKTKVIVRLDGAYFKEYWNGSPDRLWRPDMDALHAAIQRDVASVDHMVYQSLFSKTLIDSEIAKRDRDFSVIHNGVDVKVFKQCNRPSDGFINLFHIGKVRNDYIMDSLIGVYKELKARNIKTRLIIAGSMDAECTNVYNNNKNDPDIKHLGSFSNTQASAAFAHGDIFLGPRMGSSCDNVIVEAMASGLPVVIPKWGGNAELINDGQEGIIIDSGGHWNYGPDYILKIADAVEQIIPDLSGFKQRARQHAINNLTIEKMVDNYLKVM
jgi:glycosyltransferase involved in cell wall biosynthesis